MTGEMHIGFAFVEMSENIGVSSRGGTMNFFCLFKALQFTPRFL